MKQLKFLCLALTFVVTTVLSADNNIRAVNFKFCVENSKLGKQEQAAFEALKKQMETNLAEKEKSINELAAKFDDPDYLDSLSADAETELKRKLRSMSQDFSQLQNQYLQALQQTNMKVVQKLTEVVGKASATVAQRNQIDFIVNDEATFFATQSKDISQAVVGVMDEMFDKDSNLKETTVPTLPADTRK